MKSKRQKLKPDSVMKDYWSDNSRFADLFNQVFFDGNHIIEPRKLADKDTDESMILPEDGQLAALSRSRDIIKLYENEAEFVLIGLENQQKIHYAMPVRNMLYDALRYARQCKILEQEHRRMKDLHDADEFLSGMAGNDCIKVVITLVFYYGEKPWDGPTRLSDMMEIPAAFQPYFNNYAIHLLQVRDAGKYSFDHRDNRDLFTMLEEFYSHGFIDMEEFGTKYSDKTVYWETMAAIGAITGIRELVDYAEENRKGGSLHMCTALRNLIEEGKMEGLQEGLQEGKREGKKEGKILGVINAYREFGLEDLEILEKLRKKFNLSTEEAQDYLNVKE